MLKSPSRAEHTADRRPLRKLDWKRALGVDRLRLPGAPRRPEQLLLRRLRRQDFGRGPVAVERISGGISNHNFAVRTEGGAYFARLCQERPLLGIDRRNEVACHQAASSLGIAPEVIHHEDGLLISRLVPGTTLTAADLREQSMMARLAALLGQLHRGWDALSGEVLYFCPFQTVRTYARTAQRLKAGLPGDLAALLEDSRELSRRIAPFRPVLCHNDLLPANLIDDGRGLWLVDWEYAGAGHPLFDLANASANAAFSAEQDHALLEVYRGRLEPTDLAELRIFKAISLLRESMWATIQSVSSDIDFDYESYAAENLQAYCEARGRLE
jgi:thiamine kinase-like enzyme